MDSPRLHIWHHDYDLATGRAVNSGVIFSCWGCMFGTAYVPPDPPARVGFGRVERFPATLFEQALWPPSGAPPRRVAQLAGVTLIAAASWRYAI